VFDLFGEHQDIAREWMFNRFKLIDLSEIPDEEIRQHNWSYLLEMLLKHIDSANIMAFLEELSSEFKRIANENAEEYVLSMLHYVLAKANLADKEEFFEWVKRSLPKELEKKSMTIAEQLRSEGVKQGMQQGEKKLVIRLLNRRFSAVPAKYVNILENSDQDALLEIGERILVANTIDEIFKKHGN
jgi:Uncharacterized conserved protein